MASVIYQCRYRAANTRRLLIKNAPRRCARVDRVINNTDGVRLNSEKGPAIIQMSVGERKKRRRRGAASKGLRKRKQDARRRW